MRLSRLLIVAVILVFASVAWARMMNVISSGSGYVGAAGGPDVWYYTAAGASPASFVNIYEDTYHSSPVTIAQDGTATQLDFWYDDVDLGTEVKLALHNSSGTVIANCTISSLGTPPGWNGSCAINQAVTAGTYYISANVNDNLWFGYDSGGTALYQDTCTYATAPCAVTPSGPNAGSLALRVYVD